MSLTSVSRRPLVSLGVMAVLTIVAVVYLIAPASTVALTGLILGFSVAFVVIPALVLGAAKKDWFHPMAFPLVYVSLTLSAPVFYSLVSRESVGIFTGALITPELIIAMVVALVALWVGVLAGLRTDARPSLRRRVSYRRLRAIALVLVWLSVAAQLTLVVLEPNRPYGQSQVLYGLPQFLSSASSGLFLAGFTLVLIACTLEGRVLCGVAVGLVPIDLLMFALRGSRDELLSAGILLLWFVHRKRPIRVLGAAIIAGLIIGSMMAIALFRDSGSLNIFDRRDAVPWAVRQVSSPIRITADLLEVVPEEQRFLLGRTYLESIKYSIPGPVPEALFGRPQTGTYVYRDMFGYTNPDQGYSFGMVPEAYLNFGWVGLVVVPMGFGALLGWGWNAVESNPESATRRWFYPIMVATLPYTIRSDSLTFLSLVGGSVLVIYTAMSLSSRGAARPRRKLSRTGSLPRPNHGMP